MTGANHSDRSGVPRSISIALAVVAALVLLWIGVSWPAALLIGVAGYGLTRVIRRRPSTPRTIDPFTLGEPWRRFVQGAQRARTRLHETVESADDGPLKQRMMSIVERLDDGLAETWAIARRGDEIDDAVRRLDPSGLRSKLAVLEQQQTSSSTADHSAAIDSIRAQIDATERLQAQSTRAADRLRLTQIRLDELVARAAEVAIGSGDTARYEHDVDDVVIELEAVRQAVEETNRP